MLHRWKDYTDRKEQPTVLPVNCLWINGKYSEIFDHFDHDSQDFAVLYRDIVIFGVFRMQVRFAVLFLIGFQRVSFAFHIGDHDLAGITVYLCSGFLYIRPTIFAAWGGKSRIRTSDDFHSSESGTKKEEIKKTKEDIQQAEFVLCCKKEIDRIIGERGFFNEISDRMSCLRNLDCFFCLSASLLPARAGHRWSSSAAQQCSVHTGWSIYERYWSGWSDASGRDQFHWQ